MDEVLIPLCKHILNYIYTFFRLVAGFYFETCQQDTGCLTSLVNGIFSVLVEAVRENGYLHPLLFYFHFLTWMTITHL